MSLLFNLVFAGKATGTHHKLALDALRHLRRHDADEWCNVFLAEIDAYLKGSKAPDDDFKDFRNHVLHVRDNHWGGAIGKAQEWYGKTVQALSQRQWPEAVYNAGVLSHYFTDPLQPFHTGQSEREMIVHRAAEWSICKCYEELQSLLVHELGGYPEVVIPAGDDWLAAMIRQGAALAHSSYDLLIDHYNLSLGVKNPQLGYDREGKLAIARLIGVATVGFSRVLERAILEASVLVPHVVVAFQTMFESMQAPMRSVAKRMLDAKERALVEAMFAEFARTGKVLETLPEDDRLIRRLHAEEVLKIPLAELDKQKPGPIGSKYSGPTPAAPAATAVSKPKVVAKPEKPESASKIEKPAVAGPQVTASPAPEATPSTGLSLASPLVDAPSIGPKTAERFVPLGIRTIGQFLQGSAAEMARKLNAGHMTAEVIEQWQDQTRLMLALPKLRARDVQLLVGVGVRSAEELAGCNARELQPLVSDYCGTSAGERILRDGRQPDLNEVSQWVVAAKKGQYGKAA